MFNSTADQIFVVAPRNAGGGIVSLMLSLDQQTAALDFKTKTLDRKLREWKQFSSAPAQDAHLYGFCNFGQDLHTQLISSADHADRYVHKCHFYELDAVTASRRSALLDSFTGQRRGIGIYLTDACVRRLRDMRPDTPVVDWYQLWIYNNQARLLREFYDIHLLHVLPFSDMLEPDVMLDHLTYCRSIFDLDTDVDTYHAVLHDWYRVLGL